MVEPKFIILNNLIISKSLFCGDTAAYYKKIKCKMPSANYKII